MMQMPNSNELIDDEIPIDGLRQENSYEVR
jgi:hypothetical protein